MKLLYFIHDFFIEYPGFLAFLVLVSLGCLLGIAFEFWLPCCHLFQDGSFCSNCGLQLLAQCPCCGSYTSSSFCSICGSSVPPL